MRVAKSSLSKTLNINIRLSERDVYKLKSKSRRRRFTVSDIRLKTTYTGAYVVFICTETGFVYWNYHQKLGIDIWYANTTTLHWDDQGNLIGMDYKLDRAAKKLDQYTQFCHESGLDLDD